ncbi:MAG: universal stress protein [Candidatus Omnitrophica bacterium]|nr:universal stress protein [Candidatus Omnitrophota bacterium]
MLKKSRKHKIRILFAYDGSKCSDAALQDLQNTGFPRETEILILSVVDSELSPNEQVSAESQKRQMIKIAEAQALVQKAEKRIKKEFPRWKIKTEIAVGSPASMIVQKADEWKVDLIVLGSHGRTAFGRMRWGSVSQSVATHAHCSVRISRPRSKKGILKILVGLDGSRHSKKTVQKIVLRTWPSKTEIQALAVFDPALSTGVVIDPGGEYRYQWLTKIVKSAEKEFIAAGLQATGVVRGGDPRQVIVHKAKKWGVDCIFVGAKGHSQIERILFGSVSSAVAMRANCSVEIVR